MTTAHKQSIKDAVVTGLGMLIDSQRVDPASVFESVQTVPLAKQHTGMKVDYRGMLMVSRSAMRPSDGFGKFMLEELEKHLTELGERYYQGDLTAVDEFLQLYCIAAPARASLLAPKPKQVKA